MSYRMLQNQTVRNNNVPLVPALTSS